MDFLTKFNIKMPKFLTIQKPDIRQFSVNGFAATLKPNDFDGTNYKRWHAKMVLWLTAMNCYHTVQDPDNLLLRRSKSSRLPIICFEAP